MERNGVKEIKIASFDCDVVDVVESTTNSSCEVNLSYTSSDSQKSCDVINVSFMSSKSQKFGNIISLCYTSSTSQKSCEVINLSNTLLANQNNRPRTKTKKKQKQDKSERKITLDSEESLCLFDNQARPNLKCVISGSCRTVKHKCREKLGKRSTDSLSEKPSKCQNKTSLLVPEKLKKHNVDFSKSEETAKKQNSLKTSSHVPKEKFNKHNMEFSNSKKCSKSQNKTRLKTSLQVPDHSKHNTDSSKSEKTSKKHHKTSLKTSSHGTDQKLSKKPVKSQNTNSHVPEHKLNKHSDTSRREKISKSQNRTCCLKKSLYIPVQYRKDRIRPCCFRRKCNTSEMAARMRSCRSTSISKETKKRHKQKKTKPNQKGSKNHRRNRQVCFEKHKKSWKYEACIGELSPISMSPLPQSISSLNISYEDISMDSFATQSEEELDTLIKRTKERERSAYRNNLNKFSLPLTVQERPQMSAPYMHHYDNEDGSTIYTEDMDVSVHSLSTVVLTPHLGAEVYSPTMSPTDLLNYKRTQGLVTLSARESDCVIEAHLKKEPYSPSTSPGRIICPQYAQRIVKKETPQHMRVEEKICSKSSIGIKEEIFDFIEVKRELCTPPPMIYNVSNRSISE